MFHVRTCINICTKLCKLPIESRKLIKYRQFRTSAAEKSFVSYENTFSHSVLESNEKCSVLRRNIENTEKIENIDFNQNWRSLTTDNVLVQLKMVGSYIRTNGLMLSDERFDEFVDIFAERCSDFTDDQLIKSLQILINYPPTINPKSRNFVELWKALDDTCVERLDTWDYSKILYICDHWYCLKLGKVNKFNLRGSLKIGRRVRRLPPHQLVQTMFYVNIRRSPVLEMFDFEINLSQCFDELSLNDIAIMSIGFFKTQTKLQSPDLVDKIYKRLISEIDTVSDMAFVCILKTLRYSSKTIHVDWIKQLYEAANGRISQMTLFCCLHLALLGTSLNVCHQNCMEQIIRRFSENITSLRLKDMERIAFVIGLHDFESEDRIDHQFCQSILAELKNRVNEIIAYPHCFPSTLYYLAMKGYYDEELLNVALSKKFLDFAYGSQHHYGKGLFSLDSFVQINLKGLYKGNELTTRNRKYMGKMLTQYIPDRSGKYRLSTSDQLLLEVKETVDVLCGHSYFAHALPHFDRPDVIIAYDKSTNTGIDIAHNFPEPYSGTIIDRAMLLNGLNVNTSDVEIVNIIAGGWNNYVRDTNKLSGLLKQKIEQSKIVGFRSVLIPWYDWTRLLVIEREHYIKHKIKNALQQK